MASSLRSAPPHQGRNQKGVPTPSEFLTHVFDTLSTIASRSAAQDTHAHATNTSQVYENTSLRPSPLSTLPDAARPLLTTLHLLCPAHLLPALDLLDRGMVQRVTYHPNSTASTITQEKNHRESHHRESYVAYYVLSNRSAHLLTPTQPTPTLASRLPYPPNPQSSSTPGAVDVLGAHSAEAKSYTVHLRAWNCDCPAFTYSAYATTNTNTNVSGETLEQVQELLVRADKREERQHRHAWPKAHADGDMETVFVDGGLHFGGLVRALREHKAAKPSDDVENREGLSMPPLCKHIVACCLVESCPSFFLVAGRDAVAEEAMEAHGARMADSRTWKPTQARVQTRTGRGAREKMVESIETMAGAAALGGLW